jgi:osmotically-inducible protein OsmY
VALRGETRALWRRYEAIAIVEQIPGVTGVDGRDLRVPPSGLSDAAVEQSLRQLLSVSADLDDRTLAVSVKNGTAVLSGSVLDQRSLQRVIDLVAGIRGVREIENLTTVSTKQQRRDSWRQKRLQEALAYLPAAKKVLVTVFGDVAVLEGEVPSLAAKRHIVQQIRQRSEVGRVVDKLRPRK